MVNDLSAGSEAPSRDSGRYEGFRVDAHGRRESSICGLDISGAIGKLVAGNERNAEIE